MDEVTMVEFPTTSAAGSAALLERVFGWRVTPYGPEYADVEAGAINLGFQQDASQATAAPLVVIQVSDLTDARAAIEANGGVVTVEPFSFPGGRRLHFREPGGNELAVWVPA